MSFAVTLLASVFLGGTSCQECGGLRLEVTQVARVDNELVINVRFKWTEARPIWLLKRTDSFFIQMLSVTGQRDEYCKVRFADGFLAEVDKQFETTITIEVAPGDRLAILSFGPLNRWIPITPRND
jgi:hypothetical protein